MWARLALRFIFLLAAGWDGALRAQSIAQAALADAPAPASLVSQLSTANNAAQATVPSTIEITLDQAIRRAQFNEPAFAASMAADRVAQLNRAITLSALLPGVVSHNQVLYTQPNGDVTKNLQGPGNQPSPRFIANNAVREYASQAVVTETVGVAQIADLKRASATAARTAAEAEIARRGLVATVVSLFYSEIAAARKLTVARRAEDEARAFTELTQQRELGRESAHADVVKAQLLEQQRERDLEDAALTDQRARLELAVLLFVDPHTPYTLASDAALQPLPTRAEIEAAAVRENPDLRAALAGLHEDDADLLRARAAYLPDLGLNFAYGIDAPQFAVQGPLVSSDAGTASAAHVKNLGYSAAVTVDIPVWDWLSTDKRIKQAEIRRQLAQVQLTAAQRRLVVELDEFYEEAVTAARQMASLAQSTNTAEESLRLTKLRYSAGEASVLEVVDAQTALTLAENAGADGEARYQTSLASLQTLTGKL